MAHSILLRLSALLSVAPLFHVVCQDTDIAISFSQPLYLVNENSGSAKPELVLNKTDCSTLSVWVNVKEITAKGGEDYSSMSSMRVLIPGGQDLVSFDIQLVDNVVLEGSETFTVSIDPLSLPFGVSLGDHHTAEVVIEDNDVTTVEFEESQFVTKEDENIEFTLSLSQAVPFEASLTLQKEDDTTTSKCDYEDRSFNVPIPLGVTSFKYNFTILDDDVYEKQEVVNLKIVSANHRQVRISRDGSIAKFIIMDDEELIDVQFSEVIFNFNENDRIAKPMLTLSRPTPCCINIFVEVEDLTADGEGVDYGEPDKTQYHAVFPAGTNCSSFDIPISDDEISEDDELFRMIIVKTSLPFGVTIGNNNVSDVVILDDDNYLRFSDENYKVYENKGSSFCVTLGFDKPAVIDTVVEVNAVNDTAFSGVDYEPGPYLVSITKGDISAELCINISDDKILEDDKTFNLIIRRDTLHPDVYLMDPYQATVTILDNEYTFCFKQDLYSVKESDLSVSLHLNFSRPLPSDIVVRFRFDDKVSAYANESARNASDVDYYTQYSWPDFDTVEKGTVNYTLNLTIVDDERLEDRELIRIFAINPNLPDGEIPCQADVIIIDDDDFEIGFDNQSYVIASKNDPQSAVIIFHKSPKEYPTGMFPINVTIHQVNETAVGGLDFHNENYFYSFKDENDSYKLILNSIDDNLVEPDETYYLNVMLTGGKYHGIRIAREYQTVTVTIIDDDECVLSVTNQAGKDRLVFSKQLAADIIVNITYDGNQHSITELTSQQTRNPFPLPISPTSRISEIEVHIPTEYRHDEDNKRDPSVREGVNLIRIKWV